MSALRGPQIVTQLCACLIVLATAGAHDARGQETLRWKLRAGQQFDVEMTMNMLQTMEMMDMEVPIEMSMNMTWNVISAEGDVYTTEQTIDRMRMKMDIPMMGAIDIDTNKDKAGLDAMAAQMADSIYALIGEKFTIVMNSRGEVTKVVLPDSMENAGDPNNPMSQMFSADQFKQMSSMATFPEGAVAAGDSWDKDDAIDSPMGNMKMSNKLTYKGVETVDGRSLSRIDVDTKIDLDVTGGEQFGMTMNLTKAGGNSTIYFDNAAGVIVKQTGNQSMEISMDMGGQVMGMTMKQDQTITFKPKN